MAVIRAMIANGKLIVDCLEHSETVWGVSQTTAYGYHTRARAQLREAMAADAEAERVRSMRRRDELYAEAVAKGDTATALAVERDRSRLLGQYPTDRAALARAGLDESTARAIDAGASPVAQMIQAAVSARMVKSDAPAESDSGRAPE